jgi:hypothetical protein
VAYRDTIPDARSDLLTRKNGCARKGHHGNSHYFPYAVAAPEERKTMSTTKDKKNVVKHFENSDLGLDFE